MWNIVLYVAGSCTLLWNVCQTGGLRPTLFVPSVCAAVLCMNAVALVFLPAGRTLELDVDSSLLAANLLTAQAAATETPVKLWKVLLSLVFFPLGPAAAWMVRAWTRCESSASSVLGAKAKWDFARLIVFLQLCMLAIIAVSFLGAGAMPASGVQTFYTPVFGFPHRFGALHQLTTALHGCTGLLVTAIGAGAIMLFGQAAWAGRLQEFPLAYAELYSVVWLIHGFFGTIMGARRMLDHGLLSNDHAQHHGFPSYILLMFGMILIMVGGHGVRLLGPYRDHRRLQMLSLAISGVAVSILLSVVAMGLASGPESAMGREYGSASVASTYLGIAAFWVFEAVNGVVLLRGEAPARLRNATAWMSLLVMAVTALSTATNLFRTKHFPDTHTWLLLGPWITGWLLIAGAGLVARARS